MSRVWIVSSPDSFLTNYLAGEIKSREGHIMVSPEAYRAGSPYPDSRVTLVVHDPAAADYIADLKGVNNIVVINTPADSAVTELPEATGATLTVNTGEVIGTGMRGYPMELLRGLDRGVYFHVKGADSRVALVHALDVAKTAVSLGEKELSGTITLHDGHYPPVSQLAEALAHRLNGKRIYTVSHRQAKLLARLTGTTALLQRATAPAPKAPAVSAECPPTLDVIHYLFNHQYTVDDI